MNTQRGAYNPIVVWLQHLGWVVKMQKPGLYANIHAKQARIKAGSGEKMNKPGSKAAPTAKDFKESAKTAKKK